MIEWVLGIAGIGTGALLAPFSAWLYGELMKTDGDSSPEQLVARQTANLIIAGGVLMVGGLLVALGLLVLPIGGCA